MPFEITYMWNLKYGTSELIYIVQKQTHRFWKQTCGYQRGKGWGGINEFGMNLYTQLHMEERIHRDNWQHRDCVRCSVITCDGGVGWASQGACRLSVLPRGQARSEETDAVAVWSVCELPGAAV